MYKIILAIRFLLKRRISYFSLAAIALCVFVVFVVITVLSGAFVGALAAGADMIGTVGNASGTGVLLMVGILIRFYEEIGKEQAMEMHPVLRGFFGGE